MSGRRYPGAALVRTPVLVAVVVACLGGVAGCRAVQDTTATDATPPAATPADATPGGGVVSGTAFEREGTLGTHYAECTAPGGRRYRVVVTASQEYALRAGQPCPPGTRLPMPQDEDPGLYRELDRALHERSAYGGGDASTGRCGEWETNDKDAARWLAANCPPLKWGDLR